MLIPAILTGTVVSAVSVVALTGVATPSGSADPDGLRVPCEAVWNRLPEDLRADLTAVRDLPAAERPDAVAEIRADALAGEYGETVAEAAAQMQDRRADVYAQLPEELQQDLEDVRALPPGERADAAQGVRDSALAGDYGDRVQGFAERLQDRRETCRS